jgi:bacteriocin-like protein
METKSTFRKQKITLADVMNTMEVLNKKQLRQIKGGDNDPDTPIRV